jgi:uncharacterized protein YecE (DUF72 family)
VNSDPIRIGTSGWHYPSGPGTWNGVFYPKPRPKEFDELAYYARFFDTVEINTTFYGQPQVAVTAQWAARTPPGFEFAVKLYQQFTHPRMFRARVQSELERALQTTDIPESATDVLTSANQEDIDTFRRGLEPLAIAGKLGVLLAQFPSSFHETPANRVHLAALLRAFGEHPLAVELRHRSWSARSAQTRQLLEAFGAAWVWIDEPRFSDSVISPWLDAAPLAYVRLHGRNAAQWWKGDRDERYNYLYTPRELEPIAERIAAVARHGGKVRAYLNNHPNARSVVNALDLSRLVAERRPAETAIPQRP